MEEDLVGYLLNALEPAEQRRVEAYVEADPQAQQHLQLLERAFEPLAADRDGLEPPAGLAVRTLALIAEHRCMEPVRIFEPARRPSAFTHRTWWRRADVLVAASLLFCAALLVPPALSYVRYRHNVTFCANSLHVLGNSLAAYGDHHDGNFPNIANPFQDHPVADVSDRAAAGMVMPVLASHGVLNPRAAGPCPGSGEPMTDVNMDSLQSMSPEEFQQAAPELMPSYAYTLGYESNGHIAGLSRRNGRVPLMSDAPPVVAVVVTPNANSRNHGGYGQNVLFTDGTVIFLKSRFFKAGICGKPDDIYVNQEGQIRAGKGLFDFVLGPSGAHP